MTTDELLKERGQQYGSFKKQAEAIGRILNALRNLRHQDGTRPNYIEKEDTENFFLALKLCRMQTSDDVDTLDDLIGYATLIKKNRFGTE